MCWAVPTKIVEVDGDVGKVEISGAVREVGLCLIEDPRPGDYVLIHAGFAIQKVDEEEAHETLRIFEELHRQLGERDEVR
jgi:hydrogenase expression/formation protein HypC